MLRLQLQVPIVALVVFCLVLSTTAAKPVNETELIKEQAPSPVVVSTTAAKRTNETELIKEQAPSPVAVSTTAAKRTNETELIKEQAPSPVAVDVNALPPKTTSSSSSLTALREKLRNEYLKAKQAYQNSLESSESQTATVVVLSEESESAQQDADESSKQSNNRAKVLGRILIQTVESESSVTPPATDITIGPQIIAPHDPISSPIIEPQIPAETEQKYKEAQSKEQANKNSESEQKTKEQGQKTREQIAKDRQRTEQQGKEQQSKEELHKLID